MKRLLAAILTLALPASAWNGTGHRVVAAIAYDLLSPAARARADGLIRSHPDYQALFLQGAPANNPAARARQAFIAASIWADQIKSDPRFYDDDRRGARPTRLLPGFPDMARRAYWHFINLPFSQDGSPLRDPRPPHIVTELERLTRALARPVGDPTNPVYALPWVLHLVGDLHNPLHAVARFSRQLPDGDRGGNDVFVQPGGNLHSFWDGLPGPEPASAAYVDQLARRLTSPILTFERTPLEWAAEGVNLAKKTVYSFGESSGQRDRPVRLSPQYLESAKRLTENKLYIAGRRLAALLNRQLGL